jgi:hypothetical protein
MRHVANLSLSSEQRRAMGRAERDAEAEAAAAEGWTKERRTEGGKVRVLAAS